MSTVTEHMSEGRAAVARGLSEVMVCIGGDCRKARGHAALVDLVAGTGVGVTVDCQGICDGPVAGVTIGGSTRWYRRVRGAKRRRGLVEAIRAGWPTGTLAEREAVKRRDTVRRPSRRAPLGTASRP